MRTRISGLLALAIITCGAATAHGQSFEVPASTGYLPGPLGHPRYEDGGFFVAMEALYWQQTNPLHNETIAVRGFMDTDGSITGTPGRFVGSGATALETGQIAGQSTFSPGFNLMGGWRFESGVVLQIGWTHLWDARYAAGASILPPNLQVGSNLADTFLFSPVSNFPANYAGQAQNVAVGNPGATFGIWNAASSETISFVQRFDQYDVTARIPIWQTASYRNYALVGPRIVHIWDRFSWRTVSSDTTGVSGPADTATYSNTTSNNLYGVHAGCGHDWWMGGTPIGGFSVSLDLEAGLFYDFVKERAKYELGDRSIASAHSRNVATLVPEVQAKLSLWYYPLEAVQIRIGYDVMAFFNTVSSNNPVDFNYGQISPVYNTYTVRMLNGASFGIGFVF